MGRPVARDIVEGDPTVWMEDCGDKTDRSLETMDTGSDPTEVMKTRNHTNGAVAAHSQISDVVEEEDPTQSFRKRRWNKKGAHENIGTPRLIDDGGSVGVEAVPEFGETFRTGTRGQRGAAGKDEPGGLAAGVGIDDFDRSLREWRGRHEMKRWGLSVGTLGD